MKTQHTKIYGMLLKQPFGLSYSTDTYVRDKVLKLLSENK